MNSPIPSSTLFSEATFDLIIPESLIEKPLDNLECSRITQREFVFFDEILTLYLCVSIPRLDASTSEATRISMLEHWVTSLDVNTQSIIHNGSDAIPRSSSLSLSKLPITPLSQTSPTSPMSPDSALTDSSSLMQSPSDNSQENIGLNSSDSSIPRKFSTPSKFDVGPSGRGYAEHPSFRQYHYTYNRRAPGCKPLVHPSGTILIPLRVPVAFTPVKNGPPKLSLMIIVTQSTLSSVSQHAPLLLSNATSMEDSEYMPDLHDTVNILSSLKSTKKFNENLPSLRIQKFRSHGFQNIPPLRRVLQKKIQIKNALYMSIAGVPQRSKDNTVLLNVILENATTEEIHLNGCKCKEAEPLSPVSLLPFVLKPLDQISLVFIYYTHRNSGDVLQVTLMAQYALKHGQPLSSQWVCRMQNPLPIFRAPSSSSTPSTEDLNPSLPTHSVSQKSILKKRLSLTEEALLQMTKVFSKNSTFTKKLSLPHVHSTPNVPAVKAPSTLPSDPTPTPTDFPLILTFTIPDPIFEHDNFYLSIQLVNRSPNSRRISIKVPNRNNKSRRPHFEKLFLDPTDFEVLSGAIHSTKENLLCLENELHLKPLLPDATLTIRIQFQALREGVHSIESFFLVDHTACRELEIKDSLQVYVRSRKKASSVIKEKSDPI